MNTIAYWFITIIIIIILLYLKIYMKYGFPKTLDVYDKKIMSFYDSKLSIFEKKLQHEYPLGNDYFIIDHGNDYVKFFKRLGKVHMQIYMYNKYIIGTVCYVLRKINGEKIWYICDLKIESKHRGNKLTYAIFIKCLIMEYFTSNRCYAISMNDNKENRIVRLAKNIGGSIIKFDQGPKLYIYQINSKQLKHIAPMLNSVYGPISYVSLRGIKDLILKSTNQPMKLLHINYDNCGRSRYGEYFDTILVDYQYMFCCTANSEMKKYLDSIELYTKVTATIIHHNMNNFNWDFIQTHEI